MTLRAWLAAVAACAGATAAHALTIEYALDRPKELVACDERAYRGARAEALACYRNLVNTSPDTRIKADAARAAGDVRGANAFFQAAIKEYPDDPALRTRWGELFVATHQNNEAVKLFQEALEIDPKYAPAKIGLAKIAAGQYDEAERRIERAVRSFIPSRAAKLTNLHHLAALRHAQGRWAEAAELCRGLLRFRPRAGSLAGVARDTRLMLADSLLEQGDLRGAHDAIAGLYDQRLALSDATNLLAVQLDYESRVGAWEQMAQGVASKVQLAELLPAERSARAQALLALAAQRTGQADLAQFLRRRAELLTDVSRLTARRGVLSELWPGVGKEIESPADAGTTMNDDADGGGRGPGIDPGPAAAADDEA